MEGQSFFWFVHLFIKELNNEDRWQVPDQFGITQKRFFIGKRSMNTFWKTPYSRTLCRALPCQHLFGRGPKKCLLPIMRIGPGSSGPPFIIIYTSCHAPKRAMQTVQEVANQTLSSVSG
jgi:hypothetical protein